MTKEFYQILGVNEEATPNKIKKAYRKLASQWHPDKWSNSSLEELETASEEMKKINQAYGVLIDEEKRKKYDIGIKISDSNPEAEVLKEEIEEIRRKIRIIEEYLLRRRATEEIDRELSVNNVHTVDLDPQLWAPYENFVGLLCEIELEKEVKDAGYNDWKPNLWKKN